MSLPVAVSLEQLRKQAKDLRKARSLKLSEAQFEIARRYGFGSWPRLRAYVDRVATAGSSLQHAFENDPDYYAERAEGLLASAADGTQEALAAFERWSAPLSPAGARLVVARNHGFTSWTALRRHVADLRAEPFARAFQAILARDFDGLRELLERFPELVTADGTNGNDLLGLAASTCDERLVAVLLEAGADVAHANTHGWTALHQAGYSNLPHMARLLLAAGAPVHRSARGDGGTPLAVALFWGNREVAAMLAEHGVVPRNLRTAAGLDDIALVEELWSSPEAGAHRGFYRPHGGFPAWRPSSSATEIGDEAMSWAARADAVGAISALHRLGASLDADVYRGTPLTWAAACGRVRAVRRLLELGAAPSAVGTFGGPRHGVGTTALHHAAEDGHLEVIEVLLDAGADPTITDELYGGTPANWASHGGHEDARALLLARGGTERA
ncbi:MAG: ankyrin repeat domain-containing protein [Actinophytocola sp.]|uniref:ankyrin repeat domain-containing protein n=1 Tax=Actinophytocola sp. TaxID=1872138 RepID=UPI003D6BC1BA